MDECCPNWETVKDFTIGVSSGLDGVGVTIGESVVRFSTDATVVTQLSNAQDTDLVREWVCVHGRIYPPPGGPP